MGVLWQIYFWALQSPSLPQPGPSPPYDNTNGAPFMPFSAQALQSPRGPWPFLLFTGNQSGAGAWLDDQVVASRQAEAMTGRQSEAGDWPGSQAVSTRQVVAGA